jgi:hypothetical protein
MSIDLLENDFEVHTIKNQKVINGTITIAPVPSF